MGASSPTNLIAARCLIAMYVDKILWAGPSDQTVRRPTKFNLVIYFNAAKALGLRVPSSLIASADKSIKGVD